MAKQKNLPSPFMLQLGEYLVPTIIAFAVIMSIILTFYAIQRVTDPTTAADSSIIPTVVDADPFEIKVLKEGKGVAVKTGDKITVNYKGTLKKDGTQFDSSYAADRDPFTFTVGVDSVISGWTQGVIGMKIGEKRQLQIPASLGYGAEGQGPIPGNATLMFEIELLKIEAGK
jgi:FKBP-type peptidyl-prolyl cis-trans isomerase